MVNPYQPAPETDAETSDELGPAMGSNIDSGPQNPARFLGGFRLVSLVGGITGLATVCWTMVSSELLHEPSAVLIGLPLLFFGMNLALMFMLRGIQLAGVTKVGCAVLLTPVSIVLFVPVCFGTALGFAAINPALPFKGSYPPAAIFSAFVFGFAIVALVIALMVRRWARIQLSVHRVSSLSLPQLSTHRVSEQPGSQSDSGSISVDQTTEPSE